MYVSRKIISIQCPALYELLNKYTFWPVDNEFWEEFVEMPTEV